MADHDLDPLISRADLDGLVRLIDARCASHDWEGLLRIRERSRFALETGRQLWPAATLAEYRLALLAPADWATRVLDEDSGRFTVGPLTEVIAQNHPWDELRDLLPIGPRRSFVAYERALRGEWIDARELGDLELALEIPLANQDWEPEYPVPTYSDEGLHAPCPADSWTHDWKTVDGRAGGLEVIRDDDVDNAFRSLIDPWTTSSNGRAESFIVEGGPEDAVRALGVTGGRLTPIDHSQALAWMAWCGASGGAYGRRRGAALGRFGVWWMLAALGGFSDEWDQLCRRGTLGAECGNTARSMTWFRFDDGMTGPFDLSLIACDPSDGRRSDHSDDDPIDNSIILLARDSA